MKNLIICNLLLLTSFSFSQNSSKKELLAIKKTNNISIDGDLDETDWSNAPIAKDFFTFEPDNGHPAPDSLKSEVKVLYDNTAIYIGAYLYDSEPSKILKEITERDNFGTADSFGVFINGFNDGQQEFQFYVSAANGQSDCNFTSQNGEDYTWNSIWESKTKITDKGWIVEIKIPFAALRFPPNKQQIWGINFFRDLRRTRQKYTWSHINNNLGTSSQQAGILNGIKDINPPTRLFLIPYTSTYLNNNKELGSELTVKAGLDIKYGINDSFTLDAILIPDFGQTKFDNVELNLGPFEQQFNENRPFFTEGTDLFNKGELLYTRRIGAAPIFYPILGVNETVTEEPKSTNLLNALKISGRNSKGLGIGFLNATTEKTEVEIIDTTTDEKRKETVSPLTNYNVTVLDQRFNKNSSVTFINTNVTRNGSFRDANVTGIVFDLNTTKNTYNLLGKANFSTVHDHKNTNGIETQIVLGETSGNYRFGLGAEYVSKDFDKNDLGIIFQTNYHSFFANAGYRILSPTKTFNFFRLNFNSYMEYNNGTNKIQQNNFSIGVNSMNKNNHYFGYGYKIKLFDRYDYYEPRKVGAFLLLPKLHGYWFDFSSNYNYKFAFDTNINHVFLERNGAYELSIKLSPRYRFNDKFSLIYDITPAHQKNNIGFVDYLPSSDETIIAQRNRNTISNNLTGKFSINSQMNFNLSLRHYWSTAKNNKFYSLQENGRLIENTSYTTDKNSNLSLWNLDLSYSWWFAPGSQATVLYRNNSSIFTREVEQNLNENLKSLFNDNLNHTFSISIRYFIDYNQAKNWFKKP